MCLQVIKGNLLFVATELGNIKVYNMRQELVRILKNSSVAGNPITQMQILTSGSNVSIFSSATHTLHFWYALVLLLALFLFLYSLPA